jgi:transglutaminase-like putative cysteine protease
MRGRELLLRLSIGTGICALAGALIYLFSGFLPPWVTSAQALLGDRWYELELNDQRIGYLHTHATQDHRGRWLFSSELRFVLSPGEPVTMTDQLTFEATAPFSLIDAAHHNKRRDREQSVTIKRADQGYSANISAAGERGRAHQKALDWNYHLEDYLAFETWLRLARPEVGAVKIVPTLDFTRLDIIPKRYRIVDHNETGYQVENPSPLDYTSIQLDHNYVPVALEMAGLFTLKRTTRSIALGPRSALQTASYYISADRPLTDHTQIERMVLEVRSHGQSAAVLSRSWTDLVPRDDGWTLTLHANPLSRTDRGGTELDETLGFPVSSRRISRLAQAAIGNEVDTARRVAALNRYVHEYLDYEAGAAAPSVLALLDDPVGDCTEFADLFTTLARNLNIPARTVFGLAYDNSDNPAFAFHAWNEVSIDGVWQSVDPTWNQLRVDATHIPLPENQAAALQLLTGAVDLSFSIREVDYFADSHADTPG